MPSYSNQKLLSVNKDTSLFMDQTLKTECLDDEENSLASSKRYKEIGYEEILRKELPPPQSKWIVEKYGGVKTWIKQQENKGLKLSLIIMTGCVIAMFWYLQIQVSGLLFLTFTTCI